MARGVRGWEVTNFGLWVLMQPPIISVKNIVL